jgi:hypothetical protein
MQKNYLEYIWILNLFLCIDIPLVHLPVDVLSL